MALRRRGMIYESRCLSAVVRLHVGNGRVGHERWEQKRNEILLHPVCYFVHCVAVAEIGTRCIDTQ
jgi:hypothetical protein